MKLFRFSIIFLIAGLLCGPNVIMALDLQQGPNTVNCPVCPGPVNPVPCTSCASWGPCAANLQVCGSPLPSGCTGTLTQACAPPPTKCTTQDMTPQLASAVNLNNYNNDGWYGYEGSSYGMTAGGEVWFLVDPGKTKPAVIGKFGKLQVSISNTLQSGALTGWWYTVDANGCLVGSAGQMSNDKDWLGFGVMFTAIYGYPKGFPAGTRYLFKVDSTQDVGIAAQWQWTPTSSMTLWQKIKKGKLIK